jgi:hypothetical protein
VLNKSSWAWWYNTFADLRIGEALQWSAVNRTGYIFPVWDPNFHGPGIGDIRLNVGGPKACAPLWPKRDNDPQNAYGVFIIEEMPIVEAWATWPTMRDSIKPDNENMSLLRRGLNRVQTLAMKGARALYEGESNVRSPGQIPTVSVYHFYVADKSLNMTNDWLPMGEPHTSWSYKVPPLGASIPTGLVDGNGNDLLRKATPEDCYLYPGRRLITFTDSVILYDGPSRWFHGRAPVVKITLDPWPWTYLGGSMVDDVKSINQTITRDLEGFSKAGRMRRNPPMMADEDQWEKSFLESGATDKEGAKVMASFDKGDPLRPILPYQHWEVSQWQMQNVKDNEMRSDETLGRADMQALARARQMPSGDTQEQFLRMVGGRTQNKSRYMDFAMGELATQIRGLMFQFYTSHRRFQLFGFDGITKEDFDYDPGTLVPKEAEGVFDERCTGYGYRYQRARKFQHAFSTQIEPYSLHEITSMTRQLLQLRLYEGNKFPLDSWTLAKTLNLPNFGRPPEIDNSDDSIYSRWLKEQEIRAKTGAILQAEAQKIMAAADPQAMLMQLLQKLMQQQGGNGNGASPSPDGSGGGMAANGRPEGRPSTYSDPPKLEERSDGQGGTRTIISTSR